MVALVTIGWQEEQELTSFPAEMVTIFWSATSWRIRDLQIFSMAAPEPTNSRAEGATIFCMAELEWIG